MTDGLLSNLPLSKEEFALGVLGSSASLPLGYATMVGTERLLKRWELDIGNSFTFFQFYGCLHSISNALLRTICKITAVVYLIILMPILEEWVFRELLYRYQSPSDLTAETNDKKIFRILSNGVIFGAFHLNPFQGWVNLPLFVVSAVAGMVFASVREITQNFWASTVTHSLNNTVVLCVNFLRI